MDWTKLFSAKQSITARFDELNEGINERMRRREKVLHSAVCKADAKAVLRRWAESSRAAYLAELQTTLHKAIRDPLAISNAISGHQDTRLNFVIAGHPHDDEVDSKDLRLVLCGLLTEQVLASLDKAVDQMEWPADEGIPLADREAQVALIEAELVELTRERDEMYQQVTALGLRLS